jgi:DNA-binding transcriptional ArsR family regulator
MSEAEIFKALADSTRRSVFERLADGEKNATELRDGLDISQPAMSQHLAVLRAAGLVAEQRSGRNVNYRVDPTGLAQMDRWLNRYRMFWPARVEALKQLLREMDQ